VKQWKSELLASVVKAELKFNTGKARREFVINIIADLLPVPFPLSIWRRSISRFAAGLIVDAAVLAFNACFGHEWIKQPKMQALKAV